MLTIEMKFLAGKYHATPWDRQVNEGAVEWPPSPWRILRSLISTWYHKSQGEIDENTIRRIVEKLSALPIFSLPQASQGHTRHYMPLYREATTMVFDTFAVINSESRLLVMWPDVDLSDKERSALSMLLSRMGYLGRAESWIEARLAEGTQDQVNSIPLQEHSTLPEGFESVRTLAAMPLQAYRGWRETKLAEYKTRRLEELRAAAKLKGKNDDAVRLKKKDLEKIEQCYSPDLFDALHADTGDLKKAGWSQPPGSIWIDYTRPRGSFEVMPKAAKKISTGKGPTVARFAIAGQVPPRLTDAVSFAERIHAALVSKSDGSSVFTGCDGSGMPMVGHRHAFILCESNLGLGRGRRGEITHAVIYAPAGFDLPERKALDSLTRVWGRGGHDVQLILIGVGQPEDFAGLDVARGACPILAESRNWMSRTPFVPTRHPKATKTGVPKLDDNGLQIGSPEHELRRLLSLAGFPALSSIEPISSTDLAGHETRWLSFKRERNRGDGRRAASGYGYGFRIRFPEAIRGPIALGYGAHFGLGLFVPESS
jgi:CRISPR-associated protein Csb2